MKKVFVILVVLFVLSMVGTAGAQETSGGRLPVGLEMFGPSPSRFDLAAPWGVIDGQDLLPLQLAFDVPISAAPYAWDINHDGVIDVADLGMVAARHNCTVVDACYWR